MLWVIVVIVGAAIGLGLLAGLAMMFGLYVIVLAIRLLLWALIVTVAMVRSFFAPPPPVERNSSR